MTSEYACHSRDLGLAGQVEQRNALVVVDHPVQGEQVGYVPLLEAGRTSGGCALERCSPRAGMRPDAQACATNIDTMPI